MENDSYIVIEGVHKNPNNIDTIDESTKKIHGPFDQKKANDFAKGLIQKNIDNFYHRAWVVKEGLKIDDICEECKKDHMIKLFSDGKDGFIKKMESRFGDFFDYSKTILWNQV